MKKAFGFFALIVLIAILLLIFFIVGAVNSHEKDEERQLIVLFDDYSVSFGMDQEELTALLGKPSSANVTSQGISQVVYENLSLCGYSVHAEFYFSPYENNRLTHINAFICVNTFEEAEEIYKSIADFVEERLNTLYPEIAKTMTQTGIMLIVENMAYVIEAVKYAGPSWYVNIQVSRDG